MWLLLQDFGRASESFTPLLTPDDHISTGVKYLPDKCQTLVEELRVAIYFMWAVSSDC